MQPNPVHDITRTLSFASDLIRKIVRESTLGMHRIWLLQIRLEPDVVKQITYNIKGKVPLGLMLAGYLGP